MEHYEAVRSKGYMDGFHDRPCRRHAVPPFGKFHYSEGYSDGVHSRKRMQESTRQELQDIIDPNPNRTSTHDKS